MGRFRRALLTVTFTQVLCLGVGLWLHERFTRSTLGDTYKVGTVVAAEAEALAEKTLAQTRLLALVWIGGLQTAVAFVVFSHINTEVNRKHRENEGETLQREHDLIRTRNAIIFGLAKLAESRDPETGLHLERIATYSTRLATAMAALPRYRDVVTPSFIRLIGISSALHDIGKVGVEDSVLLKPGKLNEEERFRMQVHAVIGGDCIQEIERRLGNSNFLQMARDIAYCHHERWDGSGYPCGLAADRIPLSARIVAIADVYDALSAKRVYKDAYAHEKCVDIISQEGGKQFDPDLVQIFLSIESEFREIANDYADNISREEQEEKPVERRQAALEPMTRKQEQQLLSIVEAEIGSRE